MKVLCTGALALALLCSPAAAQAQPGGGDTNAPDRHRASGATERHGLGLPVFVSAEVGGGHGARAPDPPLTWRKGPRAPRLPPGALIAG
jgi:hypothetical protein